MGKKSLYGAHVGLEWDKCPDSAYMGPTYTCLLGYDHRACVKYVDSHHPAHAQGIRAFFLDIFYSVLH